VSARAFSCVKAASNYVDEINPTCIEDLDKSYFGFWLEQYSVNDYQRAQKNVAFVKSGHHRNSETCFLRLLLYQGSVQILDTLCTCNVFQEISGCLIF